MTDDSSEVITIEGGPPPRLRALALETRDRIRRRIAEFEQAEPEAARLLCNAVRALNALPVEEAGDGHWYAVRPDGDLIHFSLSPQHEAREVTDEWTRATVLLRASKRYPELAALRRPRPLSGMPCMRCDGAGTILLDGREEVCTCEGLGWLLPLSDEDEKS